MGQKQNLDCDPDYIMTQYQGRNVPTPTRLAVDDGENLIGGVLTGGGTASAGGTASNTLAAQQNISQIQENPLPPCPAHGTLIDIWAADAPGMALVQDLVKGQFLKYKERHNEIEAVEREWCESLWAIQSGNSWLESSPDHRVITNATDADGTPVNTLVSGNSILMRGGAGTINTSHDTFRPGWVYRITLKDDGTSESHWFIGNNIVQHNVKPQGQEQAN